MKWVNYLNHASALITCSENGEFIKVGSSQVQKTDVRIVAATNVNLFDAIEKGKVRIYIIV
jgi:transcriptional regulator with PAS, ATPase and Fis domain